MITRSTAKLLSNQSENLPEVRRVSEVHVDVGEVDRSTMLDHVKIESPVPTAHSSENRPHSPRGNFAVPEHTNTSSRSRLSEASSRTTSTVRARRLAVEAQVAKQQLQRDKELLELERKLYAQEKAAAEMDMNAKLAAIEAEGRRSVSRSSSRTASWVEETYKYNHKVVNNLESVAQHVDHAQTSTNLPPRDYSSHNTSKHVTLDHHTQQQRSIHSLDNIPLSHCFVKNSENHKNVNGYYHSRQPSVAFEVPSLSNKLHTSSVQPNINHSAKEYLPSTESRHNTISTGHRCVSKYIELLPFTGKATEWLMFKRTFVDTHHLFSPTENLARLRCALRGRALESVSSLLYTADGPDEVMEALEQTFALPETIVLHEIALVRSLPKISYDQKEINSFACRLRNCIAVINSLGQQEYLFSIEIFHTVLSKLTPILYSQWKDFAYRSNRSVPKLQLLSRFLDVEADKHNRFGLVFDYARRPGSLPIRENIHVASASRTKDNSEVCCYCKNKHRILDCDDFKALTFDDKWRWLREAKICYKCLKSKAHRWKTCRIKRCGVDGCERFHHPLLHPPPSPQVSHTVDNLPCPSYNLQPTCDDNDKSVRISNAIEHISCDKNAPTQSRVFLKIVPVKVSGPGGKYKTFALLDDGSTATLIDSEVASRIGATGPTDSIRVDGVAGMSTYKPVQYVNFTIKGCNSKEVFSVSAKAMDSLSLYSQTLNRSDLSQYSHLSDLLDELVHVNATPKVLVGAEHWYMTLSREVREGTKTQPVATRTALGWVLHGRSSGWTKSCSFINHTSFRPDDKDSTMDQLVKDYFRLDSIGITRFDTSYNENEQHAIDILEATTKRLTSSGRYEVGLLWRKEMPIVPDSYSQALSRFFGLERRMARDSNFKKDYCTFINGMIEKGYAEECSRDTYHDAVDMFTLNQSSIRWYLPHFPVIHRQKKKLRVVHDAAAKTLGVSLNSLLLPGPDFLQSLLGILFRFREGRVALTADVREMFPQIKIRVEDRDALRYVWREDPNDELKEYRMTSVIFGAVCSPCTALYIKNRNARELQKSYPAAAKAIINDHYMDDYLGSLDCELEASRLAADIVTVHKAAGMEMRGWVSNVAAALTDVPRELRADISDSIHVGPDAFVRTLGLIWHPHSDVFSFRPGAQVSDLKLTKRKILSHLMSLYDPLGLLTPLVIQGRILFQQTWRTGVDWDTELQSATIAKWLFWSKQLQNISNVKLPRWYRSGYQDHNVTNRQLHIFADASEQAYACVAYWRFVFLDGSTKVSLIGGKARLAPLKPSSIPRLELQAALIAARYANTVIVGHEVPIDSTYFWSDSTTVLSWIRSDARTFKPFVANRLGEITEATNIKDWRFVPSGLNVADYATRLKDRDIDLSRWFSGPDYLLLPAAQWPKEPSLSETLPVLEELKSSNALVALTHLDGSPSPVTPEPSRFSEWLRLVRATACVYQCANKFRLLLAKFKDKDSKFPVDVSSFTARSPTAADIEKAEYAIFQRSQQDSFGQEMALLRDSKPLPKSSKLYPLSPRLAEDGMLRLDSRIKHMQDIVHEVTSPIILDGRHAAVRLLIRHYHVRSAHGFNETVYNELKQRFHVLRCRSAIKLVSRQCQFCVRRKAVPQVPPIGYLPDVRLAHHHRPFTNVGLDYFGPLEVSIGRRREKRYVAVYTCMTIRAVHLEVVPSLSSDSAISSLRRFIARRGTPRKILSDNGTAFVGANRQLKEFFGHTVEEFVANHKIEWCFIPPVSPFMGGCWERLVRTIKSALYVTLKDRAPKEDLLLTLLLEAEALVNSRPLTYVTEGNECQSLTPFHFLTGASSHQQLPQSLSDDVFCLRKDWQKVLRLSEHFWSRWLKEYLPSLRVRQPQQPKFENLRIGDVVLIVDSDLPRGVWPLGRVTKLYPGVDGVVRVVDVTTKGGILKRPTRKLALLDQATMV